MTNMVERVAWAISAEEDRWRCITGGIGMQDVIVRDDDDGEPVEISRHPQGDGSMWFWDTRNLAVAAAAIKAMREADMTMLNAAVDRTGAGFGMSWANRSPQGLFETGYQAMIDAALTPKIEE